MVEHVRISVQNPDAFLSNVGVLAIISGTYRRDLRWPLAIFVGLRLFGARFEGNEPKWMSV